MSVVLDPPTADGSAAPRRATPRVPIQARLRAEAASNAAAARSMPSDPVVVAAPPAPSPPASEPGPKGRRSPRESLRELVALSQPRGLFPVVMLLCLAAVERFDATALGVLAPEIEKSFHLSDAQFVPISTISGLVPLLFSLPLGYWSDRTGRVWLARLGGLVWGVTAVATGFAPAVAIFVIARLAGGSGQLVNEVTHPSLLSDFYRPKALAPIFGFYAIAQGGIALIAGPIAGALGGAVGWRPTFVILALPTFAFVVLLSRVEEPVRGATALLDRADDSDVAADTAPAPESSASSAVGVFGVLGEIIRDMAGAYRELSAIRSLRRTWLAAAFFGGGVAPFAVYLSLFFKKEYGVSPEVRGVISALFGTFGLLGVALGAKLAQDQVVRSRAERLPLVNGLMVIEFGVGVMFMAAAPNFALALVAVCFLSIGAAGFAPAYRTLVSLIVPARIRSQAFAWSLMFLLLGAAITSVLISAIGDSSGRSTALVLLGIIVVIGGVVECSARFSVAADIAAAVKREEATTSDALLSVRGLDVAYAGGVQVLFGVDFEVKQGEVIALLGTNGAGKSTLLRAISGLLDPIGGAISFAGNDVTHLDPVAKAQLGIVQVPGGKGVFPGLTVAENLKIAGWLYRADSAYLAAATESVLTYFPILRDYYDLPAANLSGGQQQMLTIGQALLAKPKLLMIDELSLGLAPVIVEQLLATVRELAAQGTTIILVEQSVNVALTIADTAYFMEKGEVRFHGPTAELLERPDVLRSVFLEGAASVTSGASPGSGGAARTAAVARIRSAEEVAAPPVLSVQGVSKRFGGVMANADVNFDLGVGQILGIIGPNGAGKTTLFDLLCGYAIADEGTISLLGEDVTRLSPDARAWRGLGRSFQDARLFPALTVSETIALAFEKTIEVRDPVATALNLPAVADAEREVSRKVNELVELMGLQAFYDKFVGELSTGSRRVVDLACILASAPKVILFDEPSSGIAQRETEALGPLLLRIREATSASLLVIEHDMPLITSVSDEIVAMDLGRVVLQGTPDEVINDPRVVASYLGSSEEIVNRSGAAAADPPPVAPGQSEVARPQRRPRTPVSARKEK